MAKTCAQCGKPLSFFQRLGSGNCSECQAEIDRQQAEAAMAEAEARARREREAAERARAALREREAARRKCPSCGGTRFHKGWLPDAGGSPLIGNNCIRFRPDENIISSYQLYALACLNCGQVRLFLHEGDQTTLGGQG